jgi:hypothetical protein
VSFATPRLPGGSETHAGVDRNLERITLRFGPEDTEQDRILVNQLCSRSLNENYGRESLVCVPMSGSHKNQAKAPSSTCFIML